MVCSISLPCSFCKANTQERYLTNSRRGSSSPSRSATKAIVVDSPPGIIRAWHFCKSAFVLTSIEVNGGVDKCRSELRWLMCSRNAPCNAGQCQYLGKGGLPRTPTVRDSMLTSRFELLDDWSVPHHASLTGAG